MAPADEVIGRPSSIIRPALSAAITARIQVFGTANRAEASAMKLYAAQTAMDVSTEAVQVHGGYGYMRESRVEQLMRDAKILQIYAGTDEMQVIAIARDLIGRD